MSTENEFFELIACEAAGQLEATQQRRLDELCATNNSLQSFREHFQRLIKYAVTDDTHEAPGEALHRAYLIMQQEIGESESAPAVTLLSIVFDSLKPVAGLRSAGTARRQLMLESDQISVDIFLELVPAGCAVKVMVDGVDDAEVALVGDEIEVVLDRDENGWFTNVKPMHAKLEIRLPDRTLTTEPIDIA